MMMLRVYCRNYLFIFVMSIMWFIHISRLFSIFRILPNPLDACYNKYPRYFLLYAFSVLIDILLMFLWISVLMIYAMCAILNTLGILYCTLFCI